MMGLTDVWPLFGLVLRTPRLSLTPVEVTRQLHLRLETERFARPEWELGVDGLGPVLSFLSVS